MYEVCDYDRDNFIEQAMDARIAEQERLNWEKNYEPEVQNTNSR